MSQKTVGTVSVTNGSQTVDGTGTAFSSDGIDTGDLFMVDGDNVAYSIASVTSDILLTLTANYAGSTNATANYAVSVDFTPNFGLALPQTGDIEVSAQLRDAFNIIDQELLATAGITTLNGLTDTDLTGLNNNDILVFNTISSNWEPQSQSTGSGLFNIVEDLTPSLGGNVDVNGFSIVSVSNGDIIINPNGTGRVILDGNEMPGDTGTNDQVLTTNGAGVTSWENQSIVGAVEALPGQIEVPGNKTYFLMLKSPFGYTINEFTRQTSSGTATVAIEIEGTGVTGLTALGATTSKASSNATAANTVLEGDEVTLVISSVVAALDLSFTLKYTRT